MNLRNATMTDLRRSASAALLALAPVVAADAPLDSELDHAMDLTPDVENGRDLYRVCVGCHTPTAWGTPDGELPQLAGQHRSVLIKQIADIRAGNRDTPLMALFAREEVLGGPQGIADVVGYIETLPMAPSATPGDGAKLEHGEELYHEHCARCHGESGEGEPDEYFPRIHGQHYAYVLRQLRWIRDGKRRNANHRIRRLIGRFDDDDLQAIADYVSRLQPPQGLVASPGWSNPYFR